MKFMLFNSATRKERRVETAVGGEREEWQAERKKISFNLLSRRVHVVRSPAKQSISDPILALSRV